jgi:hypothetical protein
MSEKSSPRVSLPDPLRNIKKNRVGYHNEKKDTDTDTNDMTFYRSQ